MPQYKLVYMNARGRAENIRMAFEQGGVKYEDVRLEREQFQNEYKQKAPFGQVPVLEVDGVAYGQSNAILRYVGRETGLDGGSTTNALKVDMILSTLEDVLQGLLPWWMEQDPAKKEAILKKFEDESLPKYFSKLDEIVKKNKSGFSVGDSLTISDIAISNMVAMLQDYLKEATVNKYPSLVQLKDKVHDLPKIKAWIKKRPDTQF